MNNDLIERYVYAVTKRLGRKQREDVARELRGLIDDMLMERCGEVLPTEKDIRVVLTELGTPQELYTQYDEDGDKCLIGQPYYSTYKFVMKVVLASVAVGSTVASVILQILEPQTWYMALGKWLNLLWNGCFSGFSIVTLLFAFFQRRGVRLSDPFSFDDLPPVPKRTQETSRWESVAGIVICVVFTVLFLFTPQVFCFIDEGRVISLFDMDALKKSWFIILGFAACGIIREAVQLLEGQYNKKVMVTAWVTNAVSALFAWWWLLGAEVMNPSFLSSLRAVFEEEGGIVLQMFANFDVFFLGCILFALVLDTIDVTVKSLRK